jgi:U4/U6 small nuclear ribonucleoprotein PRP4
MALNATARAAEQRQAEIKANFEKRKVARAVAVPTSDIQVRERLRAIGEPICFFGESIPDRRERLRELLTEAAHMGVDLSAPDRQVEQQAQDEVFFTEGPPELRTARLEIAGYSLARAQKRIAEAKRKRVQYEALEEEDAIVLKLFQGLSTLSSYASNIGDNRPIAHVEFSPDATALATASWSGICRVWRLPDCTASAELVGHTARANAVAWHPDAGTTMKMDDEEGSSGRVMSLASASADSTVKLWAADGGAAISTLRGHTERVNHCAFHPMGKHLGSTSHDQTWKLWDVETQQVLLSQEGHSRACYGLDFQVDGSIAVSSGLEGVCLVWDIRTGHCVHTLQGHVKQVLSVAISPNGFHVASGSDDHTAKIWDLRRMKCHYTIPAHSAMISSVRWQPIHGHYLMTASYDNKCKLWSNRDWSCIKTLEGHESRLMSSAASSDGKYVATASYDRTWKLWAQEQ